MLSYPQFVVSGGCSDLTYKFFYRRTLPLDILKNETFQHRKMLKLRSPHIQVLQLTFCNSRFIRCVCPSRRLRFGCIAQDVTNLRLLHHLCYDGFVCLFGWLVPTDCVDTAQSCSSDCCLPREKARGLR